MALGINSVGGTITLTSISKTASRSALSDKELRDPDLLVDFSRQILQGAESVLRVLPAARCGWSDLGTPKHLGDILRALPQSHDSPDDAFDPLAGFLNPACNMPRYTRRAMPRRVCADRVPKGAKALSPWRRLDSTCLFTELPCSAYSKVIHAPVPFPRRSTTRNIHRCSWPATQRPYVPSDNIA